MWCADESETTTQVMVGESPTQGPGDSAMGHVALWGGSL